MRQPIGHRWRRRPGEAAAPATARQQAPTTKPPVDCSKCPKEHCTHIFFGSSGTSTPGTNDSTNQPIWRRVEFSQSDVVGDPGNRIPIEEYPHKIRDQQTWFDEFDWLEYSESKDAAYCLYCYLFFDLGKPEKFGSSVFAKDGYTNWKKAKDNLNQHSTCKTHNNARLKCDDFMNQRTNVARKIDVISKEEEKRYEIRLNSSLDVARFLIMQGNAFRGQDESSTSNNKGIYREIVDWYKYKVEIVQDAYDKGAKNCTMISHHMQKDHTKACAQEVMSVNDEGKVMERLLGLQHVESCTTAALKEVKKDYVKPTSNGGAFGLIGKMESLDFVFIIHLMIELLSITDSVSRALQRKDQDIVEAMQLIIDVKEQLQDMRDNG
uniref:Os01g0293600 protein n=1 Tax=Saccharum spontaneum TaxID=62335 RepID=A0A678T686_SACSP|nr:Os01g0293600 protein [Saccharum spontaneum]